MPHDDRGVIQRSHDVLRAYDHGDVAYLDRALASSYVHIDGSDTLTREDDLKVDPSAVYPLMSKRAWSNERVFGDGEARIFRGLADEEGNGNEVHGNYRFRGWYTLVWVRESGQWRLGMLTWHLAGNEQEDSWNAIYRNHTGFTREPNELLKAAVAGVTPGRALDVGTGQGRNALYLASLGWNVTGVDFSMEALREAREEAAARKLEFDAVYADISKYDFGADKWNLVALIYMPDHPDWIEKIKPSIASGGLFVLEYFARTPEDPHSGTDLAELERAFSGWELTRHEVVEDTPDWARNRAKLVRFVAKKP
jgi:SAM-dependent methyltransferase